MDRGTAAYFENLLIKRRDAILDAIWDRYDVTGDADPTELERDEMKVIEAALARVQAGTYGECVSCGLGIEHEVLEHLPATTECADCLAGRAPWVAPRRKRVA